MLTLKHHVSPIKGKHKQEKTVTLLLPALAKGLGDFDGGSKMELLVKAW
jgi:hypothetical protein